MSMSVTIRFAVRVIGVRQYTIVGAVTAAILNRMAYPVKIIGFYALLDFDTIAFECNILGKEKFP